ncbi:LLM class flavin-dependent oxidoreductase [Paraburkholderia metrosideri]|jgi:alkanesulfonate monooxygenase|uniref:FMNH(2)-dependent dimethylsulfone monooxygenase n=1 Tax=Paraburkholderia metrosideri TaxID=580937 RepID=A0ABM8P3G0_9BURK|nr:LLM class flavin-dependent oxidoreductase [Paraburkholderia metrosideri]CAD6555390.1 FMNH(2)-dependent dimethylsulfone monooxygenase [Paraburkholderia metrosideri]
MSVKLPRFGVWALVHGSRAALQDPAEPYDASWARNKSLVLEAERLGYDSVLVAQHTINPHDPSLDQLEAWTSSAALAALTSRIEIITAIKPYLYHPVVLAKMAQQIEHISGGRFAINVVNAWNRPELERAGIGFPEHDARYLYGREWLEVVSALLRGETVNHHGDNFHIDNYQLQPADPFRARPRIYVGGESEPARELVAAQGDVWFINGQAPDDVARLITDVSARTRPAGQAALRFGLSAFVIARETQVQADAHLAHLFALAELDKPLRERQKVNIDSKAVMHQTFAQSPRVGSNGGTAAGLVGDYDVVAQRIAAFHQAGVELFMLQFQPFEADMRSFAEEVIPRVRRLLSQ